MIKNYSIGEIHDMSTKDLGMMFDEVSSHRKVCEKLEDMIKTEVLGRMGDKDQLEIFSGMYFNKTTTVRTELVPQRLLKYIPELDLIKLSKPVKKDVEAYLFERKSIEELNDIISEASEISSTSHSIKVGKK